MSLKGRETLVPTAGTVPLRLCSRSGISPPRRQGWWQPCCGDTSPSSSETRARATPACSWDGRGLGGGPQLLGRERGGLEQARKCSLFRNPEAVVSWRLNDPFNPVCLFLGGWGTRSGLPLVWDNCAPPLPMTLGCPGAAVAPWVPTARPGGSGRGRAVRREGVATVSRAEGRLSLMVRVCSPHRPSALSETHPGASPVTARDTDVRPSPPVLAAFCIFGVNMLLRSRREPRPALSPPNGSGGPALPAAQAPLRAAPTTAPRSGPHPHQAPRRAWHPSHGPSEPSPLGTSPLVPGCPPAPPPPPPRACSRCPPGALVHKRLPPSGSPPPGPVLGSLSLPGAAALAPLEPCETEAQIQFDPQRPLFSGEHDKDTL